MLTILKSKEDMKLISMKEFVESRLRKHRNEQEYTSFEFMQECENYVKFISQPLELWMLIPCDENNEPLEKPFYAPCMDGCNCENDCEMSKLYDKDLKQYQKAKERVLFEGFEVYEVSNKLMAIGNRKHKIEVCFKFKDKDWFVGNTTPDVESLIKHNIYLTQTAINIIEKT